MPTKILLATLSFEEISKLKFAETSEEMHYPVGLTYLHSYLQSKGHKMKLLDLNHSSFEKCLEKVIKTI